jgi:hypothetical protein
LAQITKAIAAEHRLVANLIPSVVLKSIDQTELLDRLTHARELTRKSQTAIDPVARRGYARLAQAMLTARPRAEIQHEYAERVAKAAGLPPGSRQADAIRREAMDWLDANPVAPRREDSTAVRKAKAAAADDEDSLTVCYGPDGAPTVCVPRRRFSR